MSEPEKDAAWVRLLAYVNEQAPSWITWPGAPYECGRCGERFWTREQGQEHANACDRPTMRIET